jgi:hypothetical protein
MIKKEGGLKRLKGFRIIFEFFSYFYDFRCESVKHIKIVDIPPSISC